MPPRETRQATSGSLSPSPAYRQSRASGPACDYQASPRWVVCRGSFPCRWRLAPPPLRPPWPSGCPHRPALSGTGGCTPCLPESEGASESTTTPSSEERRPFLVASLSSDREPSHHDPMRVRDQGAHVDEPVGSPALPLAPLDISHISPQTLRPVTVASLVQRVGRSCRAAKPQGPGRQDDETR